MTSGRGQEVSGASCTCYSCSEWKGNLGLGESVEWGPHRVTRLVSQIAAGVGSKCRVNQRVCVRRLP